MSKCKLCGMDLEIFKSDLCKTCYEKVSNDLKEKKTRLRELADKCKNDLPQSQNDRDAIRSEANELIFGVNQYINKGIPIGREDYESLHRTIVNYAPPITKSNNDLDKKGIPSVIFLVAAILASALAVISTMFTSAYIAVFSGFGCFLLGGFLFTVVRLLERIYETLRRIEDQNKKM